MRNKLLLFVLILPVLFGCHGERNEAIDYSLAGTVWRCRSFDTEYTLTFGYNNDVTLSQYDVEKNKKYWPDTFGTYLQDDRHVTFSLLGPVVVAQQHYLSGEIDSYKIIMDVTIQDYLNGEKFSKEYLYHFQIAKGK